MPTNFLLKIHRDTKVPVKKLEKYWDKAKALVDKKKYPEESAYYAVLTKVFENLTHFKRSPVKNKISVKLK